MIRPMRFLLPLLAAAALAGCGSASSPTAPAAPAAHVEKKVAPAAVARLTVLARPSVCAAITAGAETLPYAEAVEGFAVGYRPHEEADPRLPPAAQVYAALLARCR